MEPKNIKDGSDGAVLWYKSPTLELCDKQLTLYQFSCFSSLSDQLLNIYFSAIWLPRKTTSSPSSWSVVLLKVLSFFQNKK